MDTVRHGGRAYGRALVAEFSCYRRIRGCGDADVPRRPAAEAAALSSGMRVIGDHRYHRRNQTSYRRRSPEPTACNPMRDRVLPGRRRRHHDQERGKKWACRRHGLGEPNWTGRRIATRRPHPPMGAMNTQDGIYIVGYSHMEGGPPPPAHGTFFKVQLGSLRVRRPVAGGRFLYDADV